jgi:hypothetical protein
MPQSWFVRPLVILLPVILLLSPWVSLFGSVNAQSDCTSFNQCAALQATKRIAYAS